jgi:hypothetical protein
LLKNLEVELKSAQSQLSQLIESRLRNLKQLQELEIWLHDREHELCLKVWGSIEQERKHRREVELISATIEQLKLELEFAKSALRWEGIVEVRKYGGMVLKVWKPMICVIAHHTMTLYPCDQSSSYDTPGNLDDSSIDHFTEDDVEVEESIASSIRDSRISDVSGALADSSRGPIIDCLNPFISKDVKKRSIKSYSVIDIAEIHLQHEASTQIFSSASTRSMSMSDSVSNISPLTAAFAATSTSTKYELGKPRSLSSNSSRCINYSEVEIIMQAEAAAKKHAYLLVPTAGSTHLHIRILDVADSYISQQIGLGSAFSSSATPMKLFPIVSSSSVSAATTHATSSALSSSYPTNTLSTLLKQSSNRKDSHQPLAEPLHLCANCIRKQNPRGFSFNQLQSKPSSIYSSNYQGFIAALSDLTDEKIAQINQSSGKASDHGINEKSEAPETKPELASEKCRLCYIDILRDHATDIDIGDDDGIQLELSYRLSRSEAISPMTGMKKYPYEVIMPSSRSHRKSLPTLEESSIYESHDPSNQLLGSIAQRKSENSIKLDSLQPSAHHRATISSFPFAIDDEIGLIDGDSPQKPLKSYHSQDDQAKYPKLSGQHSIRQIRNMIHDLKKRRADIIYPEYVINGCLYYRNHRDVCRLIRVIESREANLEYVRYLQSLRHMLFRFMKAAHDDVPSPLSSPTRKYPIPTRESTTLGCSMPPEALIPEFQR